MPFSAVFGSRYAALAVVVFAVAYSAAVIELDWIVARLVAEFVAFVVVVAAAAEAEHFEAVAAAAVVEFAFAAVVTVVAVAANVAAVAIASAA